MQIQVTKNKVILPDNYIVNKGEYHINVLEFSFSEEYTDDLVKKAIFVSDEVAIEQAIINNTCHIPNEVLNAKSFELRVYAYEVENGELILRYSPTYTTIYLREGSYRGNTGSGEVITPTQFEQYEQALNEGLVEINSKIEDINNAIEEVNRLDIDISKEGKTTTVEITKKDGTVNAENIYDGEGLDYNWQGTSLGIKKETEQEYEYVDLKGDCNFATFEINDNMELVMNKTADMLLDFEINENGELEVII